MYAASKKGMKLAKTPFTDLCFTFRTLSRYVFLRKGINKSSSIRIWTNYNLEISHENAISVFFIQLKSYIDVQRRLALFYETRYEFIRLMK